MNEIKMRRSVLGHQLTESQKAFLLSLPADGSWKKTTAAELDGYGRNALRGFGKSGLVEGYYQSTMAHHLTPEGVRVVKKLRAALQP